MFNEESNFNRDEVVMLHEMKLVLDKDKEELAYLNGQRKTDEIENHKFVLMESEETMPQRDLLSDKDEEIHKEGDEVGADVSQAEEESVLELKEVELTVRISQEVEGHQWHVVKKEEECYAGNNVQHNDDVVGMNQVVNEWLVCLLETFEQTEGITIINGEMSQVLAEIKTGRKHEEDIAEGDVYKSMKEVWVAAVSGAAFEASSELKAEVEVRRTEENNQQVEDECTKCNRVQWQSKEDKSCLQQQTRIWDPEKMKAEST